MVCAVHTTKRYNVAGSISEESRETQTESIESGKYSPFHFEKYHSDLAGKYMYVQEGMMKLPQWICLIFKNAIYLFFERDSTDCGYVKAVCCDIVGCFIFFIFRLNNIPLQNQNCSASKHRAFLLCVHFHGDSLISSSLFHSERKKNATINAVK